MKPSRRYALWILLGLALTFGLVHELRPRVEGPSRLDSLPLQGFGFIGRDLPLNASEIAVFQNTRVVKRLYQVGQDRLVLLAVDGRGDRHAIHDPSYCFRGAGWQVIAARDQPLPGGHAQLLQLAKDAQRAVALYWITDGHHRHASAFGAWLQSIQTRLTGDGNTASPVLVLLQPVTGTTVDWDEVLHRFPALTAL